MQQTHESFKRGDLVRFQGERYRVELVINGGRDLQIRNADGKLTVSPLSVQIGW